MIDKKLLDSLNAKDKENLQKGLKNLIKQTYIIEKEYKTLNESYLSLQNFIKQIVETTPNAIWVIDENNKIFLENSEAKKLNLPMSEISLNEPHKEIEFNNNFYLIKIVRNMGKTIISATDITDEKRKERLASMGQVAAHLSHEIRNPIGAVSLLASTLFKRVDLKNKPIVFEIQKAIYTVERIIKSTLLFTKGIHLDMKEFDIYELKEECSESVSQYTFNKNIIFNFNFPHFIFYGDKNLLALVLQNLLFNAIDAIEESDKENGIVKILINKNKTNIHIDIIDSGSEIKDKNILFEPFKSTKIKGNGLGLALSVQIIQAHSGDICLLEKPKAFRINLPA